MKAAAALAACALVVLAALPAGPQDGPRVVRPNVLVHTEVPPPGPPPEELQPFGATLVVNFWVEEAGKKVLGVELKCATPEYAVKLAKDTGEHGRRLEVKGVIQMLRDREILLVFDSELASGGQGLGDVIAVRGSAIMREGVEQVLLKTDETSLHASFTFEVES
jgi:hypothetical protein